MLFRSTELKKMIAYSSVAQIGYIFTGIGLGTPAGLAAAMFHILTHAFTKSGLFLVSGSMIHETHNKKISKMNGIGALMPITMTVFIIGGLSMIGIPPSIGFSNKSGRAGWVSIRMTLTGQDAEARMENRMIARISPRRKIGRAHV